VVRDRLTGVDASSGRLRRLFARVGTIDHESTYTRNIVAIESFDLSVYPGAEQIFRYLCDTECCRQATRTDTSYSGSYGLKSWS
jgi:hypothetical protein